jgi:hypothetical protein
MNRSKINRVLAVAGRLLVCSLIPAALAMTPVVQAGNTVPFKGVCYGEWVFEGNVMANVSGIGTHIGKFTGQLYMDMTVVLRAPDGSELWADIIPKSNGHGGIGTVTGGTGRFANAIGSWESTWDPPEGTATGFRETFVGEISSIGSAQTVPFKGLCIGELVLRNGVIANVSGTGTHIGKFTGQLYMDMTVVLRAADGSELWADITSKPTGGGIAAVTGGTGRFANATGYWDSTWDPPEGTPTGWIETFVGEISTIGANKE